MTTGDNVAGGPLLKSRRKGASGSDDDDVDVAKSSAAANGAAAAIGGRRDDDNRAGTAAGTSSGAAAGKRKRSSWIAALLASMLAFNAALLVKRQRHHWRQRSPLLPPSSSRNDDGDERAEHFANSAVVPVSDQQQQPQEERYHPVLVPRNRTSKRPPVLSKILPEPLDYLRRNVSLSDAYSDVFGVGVGDDKEEEKKRFDADGSCSCRNASSPSGTCCDRVFRRCHKQGVVMTRSTFKKYRPSITLFSKDPWALNYLQDPPVVDYRDVLLLRNLNDALISGYLYHKVTNDKTSTECQYDCSLPFVDFVVLVFSHLPSYRYRLSFVAGPGVLDGYEGARDSRATGPEEVAVGVPVVRGAELRPGPAPERPVALPVPRRRIRAGGDASVHRVHLSQPGTVRAFE